MLDKELNSQDNENSLTEKIASKFRKELGNVAYESKLETIKKIERKKLDYEIIKDNKKNQPT